MKLQVQGREVFAYTGGKAFDPALPCVVFVHGAGPAVRGDGYHELARHFARKGVTALIYDKRGCGASTGDWTRAGLYDLAEDALACVRLLRGRPPFDPALTFGTASAGQAVPMGIGCGLCPTEAVARPLQFST